MPIFEHTCIACGYKFEDIYFPSEEVPDELECPECGSVAYRTVSPFSFRMGKPFTPGGPTIHDKDGHESLGMTGEQAEASEKQQSDLRQATERGERYDYIFKEGKHKSKE